MSFTPRFEALPFLLEFAIPIVLGLVPPLLLMALLCKKTPIAVNNLRIAPWTIAVLWFYAIFFEPAKGWVFKPWLVFRPAGLSSLERSIDLILILFVPGIAFIVAGFVLHRLFRDRAKNQTLGIVSFVCLGLAGLVLCQIPMDWMIWGDRIRGNHHEVMYFLKRCVWPSLIWIWVSMFVLLPGISFMIMSVLYRPRPAVGGSDTQRNLEPTAKSDG